jgi:hypothetical protein
MSGSAGMAEAVSERAFDDAGPSTAWMFVAVAMGVALAAGWWTLLGETGDPWLLVGASVAATTGLVAILDRDAWTTRVAMAYVATQQATRWPSMPRSEVEARAWLADESNEDAPKIDRAAVMAIAQDFAQARAMADTSEPDSPTDRVRWRRLSAYLDARATGQMDVDAIRIAAATLPPDDARYHVASALWQQAWLDVERSRPWRHRFASEMAALGPLPIPRAVRLELAIRHMAAPITALIGGVIVAVTP